MSDLVWLLHLSVMISSLALKGQELYIITSGLVRRVPGVEGPVASYTCTAPKAALVKDVGLPRDWPILLEILSDGSILLRAYGQRPRCPNHHSFVCDRVSFNSDSNSDSDIWAIIYVSPFMVSLKIGIYPALDVIYFWNFLETFLGYWYTSSK